MEIDLKKRLENELDILRQTRDELRVQVHLGAADAQDLFAKAEKSWEHLEAKIARIGKVAKEGAEDVGDAASQLADEIKASFERIRKML